MSKVLVKKAMKPQMDSSGRMSYVMDVGGEGGGRGPLTMREKLGGMGGRAVGVLGALSGKHRSLAGLLGSMYAGGMQGAAVGRGLAGKTVTSAQREALKARERLLAQQARAEGQAQFDATRAQPPVFSIRGRNAAMLADEDERLARITEQNRMMDERNRQMQKLGTQAGKATLAAERRAAREHPETVRVTNQLLQMGIPAANIERMMPTLNQFVESGDMDAANRVITSILNTNAYSQVLPTTQPTTNLAGQQIPPPQFSANAAAEASRTIPAPAADHVSGTSLADPTSHAQDLGRDLAQSGPESTGADMFANRLTRRRELNQLAESGL